MYVPPDDQSGRPVRSATSMYAVLTAGSAWRYVPFLSVSEIHSDACELGGLFQRSTAPSGPPHITGTYDGCEQSTAFSRGTAVQLMFVAFHPTYGESEFWK